MTAIWLALAVVVVGAGGCARRAAGPSDTVATFVAAVERQDFDAAYGLMSSDYRKRVSAETFRAELAVAARDSDTAAVARRLRERAARGPLRAEVEVDLGEKVALVQQDGGQWRMESQPFAVYGQQTPRAALRSFVRALELRRYSVALRLVPSRFRATVTVDSLREYWEGARKAENAKLLEALRANMGAPIIELGDEAHMPYGDREVRFVREDGLWKIEDPD
ncbi:MAG TPA: hypothetical protein VFH73_00750 [Polyangia bacterium]|jgi:hypothetical protein|nr:hypothetical protein [Polyangia bacterium]